MQRIEITLNDENDNKELKLENQGKFLHESK